MDEALPLGADDLGPLLAAVMAATATGLVLAVSGGPDSMALLHLVAVLRARGDLPPVTVGTVDHGLRPGSAADATFVEESATRRGLPVRRLVWTGPKPACAVQEMAREARYTLLASLCDAVGADHLVTAHTLDDQAETVLFRLLRGSGVAGLAGMQGVVSRGNVRHMRPLLGVAKHRLVATCRTAGIAFRDDPANTDPRFARARMRNLLPLLAAERCDAPALARLAARAARADTALAHAAEYAFRDAALAPAGSAVRLSGAALAAMPLELAIRVLSRALATGGGTLRRLDRLERLTVGLTEAVARHEAVKATLGGLVFTLAGDGVLTLTREGVRRRGSDPMGQRHRFSPAGAAATPAPARFPWQG